MASPVIGGHSALVKHSGFPKEQQGKMPGSAAAVSNPTCAPKSRMVSFFSEDSYIYQNYSYLLHL